MDCHTLFTYVGAAVVIYTLLNTARNIFLFLRVYAFPSIPNFAKYGKWSGNSSDK